MAVRKGDQEQGKLQVIEHMKGLLRYTHDRVKDNKIFPKSERWLMAKDIWDAARDANRYIIRANRIVVENRGDAETRLRYEKLAIGCLDELNSLIDTAHMLGQISADRAGYWTMLTTDTEHLALAWMKANRRSYQQYFKE